MSIIESATEGVVAFAEEAADIVSGIASDSAAAIVAATADEAVDAVKRLGVKRVFTAIGVVLALAAIAAVLRKKFTGGAEADEQDQEAADDLPASEPHLVAS